MTPNEQHRKQAALKAAFAQTHGVKPFTNSRRHVSKVLRSVGASPESVRPVLDAIGLHGALRGPFDHGEIWGKDGQPMMIVGHPYDLGNDDHALLDAIRELGLEVRTDGESYYGFKTSQVLVVGRSEPGEKREQRKNLPPAPPKLDALDWRGAATRRLDEACLAEAGRVGYVITRSVDQRAHTLRRRECEEHGIPFVHVHIVRGRASVRLEAPETSPLDEATLNAAKEIPCGKGGWLAALEPHRVWLAKVPAAECDRVAAELYRLVMMNQPKPPG